MTRPDRYQWPIYLKGFTPIVSDMPIKTTTLLLNVDNLVSVDFYQH